MGEASRGLQQAIIDATSGQFDANNPLAWLGSLTSGLSGNPLSGNFTQTGESGYNPSGGEKLMTAARMIAGFK